jgi:hypothetical protein
MMTIALRRYHQLAQSAPAAAPAAEEPAVEPQDAEDPSAGIVDAELELNAMEHQGWRSFVLRVSVKEGWHLYAAEQEMEELLGVAVEIERGQLEELEYPPGRPFRQAGHEALLLEGSFEIAGRLRGEMATLSFFYQACSDRLCLPPAAIEFELGEEE